MGGGEVVGVELGGGEGGLVGVFFEFTDSLA